jgi:hypothetical protein
MTVAQSRVPSAPEYPAYQRDPVHRRGQAAVKLATRNLSDSIPRSHLEENLISMPTQQFSDVRMMGPSPLGIPPSDEGRSLATADYSDVGHHPPFRTSHRDVSQGWDSYASKRFKEHAIISKKPDSMFGPPRHICKCGSKHGTYQPDLCVNGTYQPVVQHIWSASRRRGQTWFPPARRRADQIHIWLAVLMYRLHLPYREHISGRHGCHDHIRSQPACRRSHLDCTFCTCLIHGF